MSLYFPDFPLNIIGRGGAATEALAVLEGEGNKHRVLCCSPTATIQGVHPGMSLQASLVLVPTLICRNRDPQAETDALSRLAGWAGRYSPQVTLNPPWEILLEVQGSLHLFGGLRGLVQRLRPELEELGYRAKMAAAPFPAAASLLARGREPSWIREPAELMPRLAALPLEVLPIAPRTLAMLRELGLNSVGELLNLPRSGLRKRFGETLPELLERALGNIPDPREPFIPASRFEARLELPSPVHGSEPLLFAARRLLQEFAGTLAARGEAVSSLQFQLRPCKGRATRLNLSLTRPSRDFRHWLLLLKERLERTALDHEVEVIVLRGGRQVALNGVSGDLFEGAERTEEARSTLLDRLQARLGKETVFGLSLVDDHRPERAWRLTQPGKRGRNGFSGRRPLWLLQEPLGLNRETSASWQLHGPERIEAGWWDGQDTARDYFLAETERGEKLWVYRDRRNRDWFLHGVFA